MKNLRKSLNWYITYHVNKPIWHALPDHNYHVDDPERQVGRRLSMVYLTANSSDLFGDISI